ncbi:hypothetical protein HK096_009983, partial [Nowakowskiella sp. JEL0078]
VLDSNDRASNYELVSIDPDPENMLFTPPSDNPMIGSLIASSNKLFDLQNQQGIFFVFSDLSIRWGGEFKLRFTLSALGNMIKDDVNDMSEKDWARVDLDSLLSVDGRCNKFTGCWLQQEFRNFLLNKELKYLQESVGK